tara:strand:+ start:197 stop:307 length:111 start_codon:yes stop_codon:yes gene_type:complete
MVKAMFIKLLSKITLARYGHEKLVVIIYGTIIYGYV